MVKSASWREFFALRALFFLAPFVTLIVPRTTVGAVVILSIACVTAAFRQGQNIKELFRFDLGLTLFAVTAGYLFINATWSLDPSRAFSKAFWFALVVLMTFATCRAFGAWQERQVRAAGAAFIAGLAAGTAFVLFEVLTDDFLVRLMYNVFPITRPENPKGFIIHDGVVIKTAFFELNRNVAVLLLMLWPTLLGLARLGDKRWRILGIAVLVLAATLSIMFSEHQSSQFGLVLSAIVFSLALLWPTTARRAVWVGWCLAFLLVVPLAIAAYKAELHEADWLPYSARERVVLWAYTAEQVPKAPVLGIGIGSTRKIDEDRHEIKKPEAAGFEWSAGWHAHNAFLQTWYELGAVGVILIVAAGTAVFGYIGRLSVTIQPFILAHLTAFFAIAAFSWGMWQSWLMAVTGLAAIYAAFAVRLCGAEEPAPVHAAEAPVTST